MPNPLNPLAGIPALEVQRIFSELQRAPSFGLLPVDAQYQAVASQYAREQAFSGRVRPMSEVIREAAQSQERVYAPIRRQLRIPLPVLPPPSPPPRTVLGNPLTVMELPTAIVNPPEIDLVIDPAEVARDARNARARARYAALRQRADQLGISVNELRAGRRIQARPVPPVTSLDVVRRPNRLLPLRMYTGEMSAAEFTEWLALMGRTVNPRGPHNGIGVRVEGTLYTAESGSHQQLLTRSVGTSDVIHSRVIIREGRVILETPPITPLKLRVNDLPRETMGPNLPVAQLAPPATAVPVSRLRYNIEVAARLGNQTIRGLGAGIRQAASLPVGVVSQTARALTTVPRTQGQVLRAGATAFFVYDVTLGSPPEQRYNFLGNVLRAAVETPVGGLSGSLNQGAERPPPLTRQQRQFFESQVEMYTHMAQVQRRLGRSEEEVLASLERARQLSELLRRNRRWYPPDEPIAPVREINELPTPGSIDLEKKARQLVVLRGGTFEQALEYLRRQFPQLQ